MARMIGSPTHSALFQRRQAARPALSSASAVLPPSEQGEGGSGSDIDIEPVRRRCGSLEYTPPPLHSPLLLPRLQDILYTREQCTLMGSAECRKRGLFWYPPPLPPTPTYYYQAVFARARERRLRIAQRALMTGPAGYFGPPYPPEPPRGIALPEVRPESVTHNDSSEKEAEQMRRKDVSGFVAYQTPDGYCPRGCGILSAMPYVDMTSPASISSTGRIKYKDTKVEGYCRMCTIKSRTSRRRAGRVISSRVPVRQRKAGGFRNQ